MRHPAPCRYSDEIGDPSPLADYCTCPGRRTAADDWAAACERRAAEFPLIVDPPAPLRYGARMKIPRKIKLVFPYLQLAFVGWVVSESAAPSWVVALAYITLVWVALGITALRIAATALALAFTAQSDTSKLLRKLVDSQ